MEFHKPRTAYQAVRDGSTWVDFYRDQILRYRRVADQRPTTWSDPRVWRAAGLEPRSVNPMECVEALAIEQAYYQCGRPHYKVWPDYLPYFAETRLEFDTQYLQLPFDTFVICLPKEQEHLHGEHGLAASLMVSSLRVLKEDFAALTQQFRGPQGESLLNVLDVYVEHIDGQTAGGFRLMLYAGDTVEQALARRETQVNGRFPFQQTAADIAYHAEISQFAKDANCEPVFPQDAASQILRTVVAIAFLATGHDRIIEPDVLSKDLSRYLEAKQRDARGEIQRLHDRATKRRGEGLGFTIGRANRILRAAATAEHGDGTGHQLNFQHQRCAHLRGAHTKTGYKVWWQPQLTVRPDLPVKPAASRGYDVR